MAKLSRLQITAAIALAAFAVTLAITIGQSLSDQALAVLAGAACGVAAAIPTSLLIVAVTRRREAPAPPPTYTPQPYQPPIIMVTPPQAYPPQTWADNPQIAPTRSREFTIVGEE